MKIDEKAIELFENEGILESLNAIYSNVPGGTCSGSTNCCSESVNTFYAEYLNIVQLLKSQGNLEEFAERAVRYYLTELVVPQKCPLLREDGLCAIYEARPLPCRIFGHLSQEEYEENYEAVLEQNLDAAEELKEQFGIVVPESVHSQKVSFCRSFKSDTGMTLDDRDDLVDQLFMVESRFLAADLLEPEDFNLSLVQWFAYAVLGREQAQKLRIKVSQEFTESGKSETLDSLVL